MGKKDLGEKLLEDYADVFADIVNVLIFHGKRLLKEEDIVDGPTASRYKDAEESIREHVRDIVKFDKRQTTLAIFGIENQSRVDKDMVFRVMGYDYSAYRKQIDSGEKKYPVFTLVLNFGMNIWDGPRDVISALDHGLPYAEYYEEFLSNPKIHVVDVAYLSKEVREQFTSDFRIVAEYFSAVREKREEELRYSRQEIKHVEEILDFFKVFAKDERFAECKPVIVEKAKKGAVCMCTVMDYAERQGIEKGEEIGKIEQALETAREMIRDNEGIEKIKRYTKLPEEKIIALQKELSPKLED